jgi:peroxiredoxin
MNSARILPITVAVLALGAALALAGPGHDHDHAPRAAIGKPAPDFTLNDLEGKARSLSDYEGKYVVLEWNNPDCPFVRKHYGSGNMQGLQKTYREKGVVWLTVCSSGIGRQGYYEPAELKKMTAKNGAAFDAYLQDAEGTVGRMYGAKTTPHMFVIDPDGVLIYAGAIDDKPSTRKEDIDGATNYVRTALDAAMAGKPVPVASSTPYGCSVKYAPTHAD